MRSFADPHEASQPRLAAYAKSEEAERFLAALNAQLRDADLPVDPVDPSAASLPIMYIVGAPRSGTTLLSQLVSKHLEVGYIDNLVARFWLRPAVGIHLSRMCLGRDARRSISLRSSYGTTADLAGPHEFGYFWRHWLRLDEARTHHLTAAELERVDVSGLRSQLEREILGTFGLPVVFKNVICGFQARFLTRVHPQSLFIHITRDPIATSSSILHARQMRFGTPDAWWSLKPAAYDGIRAARTPAEQVALQVVHCRREFELELSADVRAMTVAYESLCSDPNVELQRIRDAVRDIGSDVRISGLPIEPLEPSTGPPLADDTRRMLENVFARPEYV